MKKFLFLMFFGVLVASLVSCRTQAPNSSLPVAGEYIYNIPCKVMVIHPELPGKALLMLWLHGGVHTPKAFTLLDDSISCSHYTTVPDTMRSYFERTGTKAIMLLPVCKHAHTTDLQTWPDCWPDVKAMIDSYVDKGLVDPSRIYVSGSSDGGTGTWQYVTQHPDVFAAGIALSSSRYQEGTTIPVWWFTTADEADCTEQARQMKESGIQVEYKHCPDAKHGGDQREITDDLMNQLLSIVKRN